MTNIEAVNIAIEEIETALKRLNYKDGSIMSENAIESENNIIFYRTFCKSNAGKQKPLYIVFDNFSSPPNGFADDNVRSREVAIRFDIWSNYETNDSNLVDLQNACENAFAQLKYEIQLDAPIYDGEGDSYLIPYSLYKTIK